MWAAETALLIAAVYLVAGLIFAIPFLLRGIVTIDSQARGAALGFRLMILPGVVVFWPLLLRRWASGISNPPEERTAHRLRAAAGS